MHKRDWRNLVAVLLASFVVIWLYDQFTQPLVSEAQADYEEWIGSVEKSFIASRFQNFPFVRIRLCTGGQEQCYKIETTSEYESRAQVLRILSQVRESRFFNAASRAPQKKGKHMSIEIESEGNVFRAAVPFSFVETNVKAQLLLKLFQLFADAHPARGYAAIPQRGLHD